jgi:hypothetical protein
VDDGKVLAGPGMVHTAPPSNELSSINTERNVPATRPPDPTCRSRDVVVGRRPWVCPEPSFCSPRCWGPSSYCAHLGRNFFSFFPLLAVISAAFCELRFVTFIGLGLIGLLILPCTVDIDAEERGVIVGPVTPGLLDRLLRAHDNATSSERARRRNSRVAQRRHLTLARVIGAECNVLSPISGFVFV